MNLSGVFRCLSRGPAAVPFLMASLFPSEAATKDAPLRFADVASRAGIHMQMIHGSSAKDWIAEANGSGVAALDYDRDGNLDVVIVNGSTMERLRLIVRDKSLPASDGGVRLYRNRGTGRFEDVTQAAGISNPYWGTGANAADYDNDGDVDVLITTIGIDLLYRNNGDGTFSEVGQKAGLSRQIGWHTGSAFGDYDEDGNLDLFIASYLDLSALQLEGPAPACNYLGLDSFCGPLGLKAGADFLYRNNGDGTFTDVTERSGLAASTARYGFSAVFGDLNQDGRVDLFVANDSAPNFLFLNQGDGTFEENALTMGLAYNAHGKTQADMGVAIGDYDGDGSVDLLTTTFSEDYFPLFAQRAPGVFEDVSFEAGLGSVTEPYVGWACGFSDLDNDGDQDLWLANGHVYPTIERLGSSTYFQPLALFENRRGRLLRRENAISGTLPNSHRGGITGDFNNDGRVDLLVISIQGSPLLLENRTAADHSWIGLALLDEQNNLEGIGARVEIEFCGHVRAATVRAGGSYLSRSDPRVHFGLGECRRVERVTIRWPGRQAQTIVNPPIDRWIEVRGPSGTPGAEDP